MDRLVGDACRGVRCRAVLDQLESLHARNEIIVTNIGAVIGTHVGPGAIGVSFVVRA